MSIPMGPSSLPARTEAKVEPYAAFGWAFARNSLVSSSCFRLNALPAPRSWPISKQAKSDADNHHESERQ